MKLELTQQGSTLKADLTVNSTSLGLINQSPTALPHQAVHLPEGVSHLEFSVWTQQGGNSGAGQDGQSPYQPPVAGPMSRYSVGTATRSLEAGTNLMSLDGIDYRA